MKKKNKTRSKRLTVGLNHPDVADFIDAVSPRDQIAFVESAIFYFALTVGRTWLEGALNRKVFGNGVPQVRLPAFRGTLNTPAKKAKVKQIKQNEAQCAAGGESIMKMFA